MTERSAPQATVLEIQRMSTEDGPGLRTTVFFKGCSLKCNFCHNPESIRGGHQVLWDEGKCMGCWACVAACPQKIRTFEEDHPVVDGGCTCCGSCVDACPTQALEMVGSLWTVEALIKEVLKDRAYFGEKGGVTASGGEPTLQAPFVAAFLAELRAEGVRTALDSCCHVPGSQLLRAAEHADLVLADIKHLDAEEHRRITGHSNERILANLGKLRDHLRGRQKPGRMWIRTPLIPGATADRENIRSIGSFIGVSLRDVVDRWDLCGFNNLCQDKYRRLGLTWELQKTSLLTEEELEQMRQVACGSGVDPSIVHVSGATALESESTHGS